MKIIGILLVLFVVSVLTEGKRCKNPDKTKCIKKPDDTLKVKKVRDGDISLTMLKYNRPAGPIENFPTTISMSKRNDIQRSLNDYVSQLVPDQVVRDFDTDASNVAKAMSRNLDQLRKNQGNLDQLPTFVSVNGSHPEIPHRVFNKYKVKAAITGQHSNHPKFSPIKPTTVVTKWVHNHLLANSTESVISEEVTRKTGTSTSMTSTVGGSVTASMSLNFWVASVSASVSVGGSFSTTSTTEQEDVKTFMLQDTITVSPNSSAKVIWNIMERDMALTWDAQLKIEGYFAIGLSKELYFVPVTILPYFFTNYQLTELDNTVVTTISGVMKSQTGTESTVTTIDFPLQTSNRFVDKCSDGISIDKAVKG